MSIRIRIDQKPTMTFELVKELVMDLFLNSNCEPRQFLDTIDKKIRATMEHAWVYERRYEYVVLMHNIGKQINAVTALIGDFDVRMAELLHTEGELSKEITQDKAVEEIEALKERHRAVCVEIAIVRMEIQQLQDEFELLSVNREETMYRIRDAALNVMYVELLDTLKCARHPKRTKVIKQDDDNVVMLDENIDLNQLITVN